MAANQDNNTDRFFKNGKSRLPFKHPTHYPTTTDRLIQNLKVCFLKFLIERFWNV